MKFLEDRMEVDKLQLSSASEVQYDLIMNLWSELNTSGLELSFGTFMVNHALNILESDKRTAQMLDHGQAVEEIAKAIKHVKEFQQAMLDKTNTPGAMD